MKKIIGICGKSGAGKTYLANIIKQNIPNTIHIDIDKVGHEVTNIKEVKEILTNSFGKQIIKDNQINRKELGNIVFTSEKMMKVLIEITWPFMEKKIVDIINESEGLIILDWNLLPKTNLINKCVLKILCETDQETRIKRLMKRDNIDINKIKERDNNSCIYKEKEFDLVFNGNNIYELLIKISNLNYKKKIALYSGSFDPITNGHVDVIEQSLEIFDDLYIAVMKNTRKNNTLLTIEERMNIIKEIYKENHNLKVVTASEATVDLAKDINATHLIRGIRNSNDLVEELQLRQINFELTEGEINTIFLSTNPENQHISSSVIRELNKLGKNYDNYVPEQVASALKNKCQN